MNPKHPAVCMVDVANLAASQWQSPQVDGAGIVADWDVYTDENQDIDVPAESALQKAFDGHEEVESHLETD